MIHIENLTKKFGSLTAVDNLSLTVPQGEFFAFLGPNAAGKTTTIKLLTGLMKPSAGTAKVCGYDVQKEHVEAKRRISYIPDFPFLYEKLTGREFLEFIVRLYGRCGRDCARAMDEFLELFGLAKAQDYVIESYSHGMRQKLVFIAAFIHEPEVMIIDEPMVGLDPHAVRLVKDLLRQKAKQGTTIFLSTHTLSVAEELAGRIGIIDHGRLIAAGTVAQLSESAGLKGKLEDIFLRLTEEEVR